MEREDQLGPEVIDLGAATEATKGAWGIYLDEVLMHQEPGLSID